MSHEPMSIDHLLRFVSRAERLEQLPRTGWIVSGIAHPESIASHSYMVTLIALWIADHLPDADPERTMRMALLHDAPEALLTDLPGPVKHFIGKDLLKGAEARAAHTLLADAPPRWLDELERYEARGCLEARIVKSADHIQMLAKALQYTKQQRGDLTRFWKNPDNFKDFGIPLVAKIIARLRAHHDQEDWYDSSFD